MLSGEREMLRERKGLGTYVGVIVLWLSEWRERDKERDACFGVMIVCCVNGEKR